MVIELVNRSFIIFGDIKPLFPTLQQKKKKDKKYLLGLISNVEVSSILMLTQALTEY